MATAQVYEFTFKELATLMVRDVGVREGHWGAHAKFGLRATNLGPDDTGLMPAAVVPLLALGLQRFEKPNNLTVDAAEVNSRPKRQGSRSKGSKARPKRR